jgi:GNAT superfamily N-acetyltransferase
MIEALEHSPLESSRFGIRVARWRGKSLDAPKLAREIYTHRADLVILRMPSEHSADANHLSVYGLHLQYADTLVYHEVALLAGEPLPYGNQDVTFAPARAEDAALLEELVRICFTSYQSHYSANPRLDQMAVREGYVEWALQHVKQRKDSLHTWLAKRDNKIIGFAACREDTDTGDAEIVLNGVHPDHAGGGVYSDLVRFVRGLYATRGRKRLLISTQITNRAAQKAWARQGFRLLESWTTFHLNPWLSAGELAIDANITFGYAPPAQVIQAQLRELVPEVVFQRTEEVLLHPFANLQCRLQIRFADGIPTRGRGQAVALAEDPDGRACLAVFLDLLRP